MKGRGVPVSGGPPHQNMLDGETGNGGLSDAVLYKSNLDSACSAGFVLRDY